MKKLILSVVNLVLASFMLLILLSPVASFNKSDLEEKTSSKEGQLALGIYFVESLFIENEDVEQSLKLLADKELELSSQVLKGELTVEEKEHKLLISPEKNRFDVYTFAKSENLILFGFNPNSGNMIKQTKAVSGLIFAFVITSGLTVLISLISIFFNKRKIKGFGTFLTFISFLLSVAIAIVVETVLKIEGSFYKLTSTVHWALYIFIAYSFLYIIIRSILNRKSNTK